MIGIMRERTPFTRALFDKLPKLRLLVTTGKRNASIDLEAAKARNVMVCNTGGAGRATAELAIGLMLGLARHLREEFHAMRPGGGWQTTLGFDLEGKTLGILGPRQSRRQGRQDRHGVRHEADRLEREPDAPSARASAAPSASTRMSCSGAPTSSPSTRCCRRARAAWSARASWR